MAVVHARPDYYDSERPILSCGSHCLWQALGSFLLFVCYGVASIPTTYAWTFAFAKSQTLQVRFDQLFIFPCGALTFCNLPSSALIVCFCCGDAQIALSMIYGKPACAQ
jgi:hypothetical protein